MAKRAMNKSQKLVKYLPTKRHRAVWWRSFRIWQRKPHELAPLSEKSCKCACCGTEYTGNYCPRCGQASVVGRFSFRKALALFLDVWDVNNRSVFRSIFDLMLRPGYMIRDYLNGMQAAYLSPFKLFFLLATFSLIVEKGFTFDIEKYEKKYTDSSVDKTIEPNKATESTVNLDDILPDVVKADEQPETRVADAQPTEDEAEQNEDADDANDEHNSMTYEELHLQTKVGKLLFKVLSAFDVFSEQNPAIFSLLLLALFSLPLFIFFRSTPSIPDLRYSEFMVAIICTSNTYSIYSILAKLLGFGLLKLISFIMIFVTFKQFSGYSKRHVLGYMILVGFMVVVVFLALAFILGFYFYKNEPALLDK